ncbi:hypothetical protein KL906_001117 [Ogataea polymorpha]|nr:hypothetical protein KL906_001117 [Ogataea polymorpha]
MYEKVYSGAESTESVLKTMRQYHMERGDMNRHKFISRTQCHHNHIIGSLGDEEGSRKPIFDPILAPKEHNPKVKGFHRYRDMEEVMTKAEYTKGLLNGLEHAFIDN